MATMRAITIRDVAAAAGVSVASASRALNGRSHVGDALRDRVAEAAKRLDYVPHSGARSLSTRRTDAIGVVLPDLFGEFFSEMIRGIDRAAHRRGLQLLLANMHGDARETATALRAMRGRVDGLIVMSPQADAALLERHLPATLAAVVVDGPEGLDRPAIAIDNYAGARAAIAHLVACGCRQIAHIAGPEGNADAMERLRGFRDALAELTGDTKPLVIAGDFDTESGRAAGERLARMAGGIDGVFAGNDMMALGCLDAFEEAGIVVPEGMAVIGFDDVPIARYARPALTTMRVNIADLGSRACDMLVAAIEQPGTPAPVPERLVPELVIRASTGALFTERQQGGPADAGRKGERHG